MYKVESVADDDKRELIVKTCFLEEVLDLFRAVKVGLSADTLDLANLAGTCSSLDVLKVNFGVFAEVDNGTKVVVQTYSTSATYFKLRSSTGCLTVRTLKLLKQFDELNRTKQIRVLRSDLYHNRQVLPQVGPQHLLQTSKALLDCESSKIVHQPFGLEQVGVYNNSLDIIDILIVLQSPLHKARFLGEVGDPRPVIMGEHFIAQNGIRDLRSAHQVHLEQPCLERTLFGLVVLECVEEDRGGLLEHVLRHEDIDDSVKVDERTVLIVDELCSKLGTLVGVDTHKVLEKLSIVGSVADLFGVENNLIKLPQLGETGDDLVRNVGAKVNRESEVHIGHSTEVTELLTTLELVLFEPLFEELLLALLYDRTGKFKRFVLVELSLLEQDAKVLQDRSKGTRNSGEVLESLDGLWGTQQPTGRVDGNFGSLAVLAVLDVDLVLLLDHTVGPRKTGTSSKLDSELRVVESFCIVSRALVKYELTLNIGHNSLLIHANTQNLTLPVHSDDT